MTLDASNNIITLVQPQAFEGLSNIISLDLRGNKVNIEFNIDLRGNKVYNDDFLDNMLMLVAGSLDGLDNLTTFHHVTFNEAGKATSSQVAVTFCDNARAQAPPLPVTFTGFCAGYYYTVSNNL